MKMIELTLPWPPSVNHYKKIGGLVRTKTGKLYQQRRDTNETKMFYWNVYQGVKKLKPYTEYCFSEEARLFVTIRLFPPHNLNFDIDNRLKVCIDSLQYAKIMPNDNQIDKLLVTREPFYENGKTMVKVEEIHGVG